MADLSLKIIRRQIETLRSTIENEERRSSKRNTSATQSLAEHANRLRQEFAAKHPNAAQHLPAPLSIGKSPFFSMGFSDVSLLDVKIFAESILDIIAVIEEEPTGSTRD